VRHENGRRADGYLERDNGRGAILKGFIKTKVTKTDRLLRDVVALSTLPALWFQAEPTRVAESLAEALFSMVSPEFVYVCLNDCGEQQPAISAQVGRSRGSGALAEELASTWLDWASVHDPDEFMIMADPLGSGDLRVTVRPLGLAAECGVIVVGFSDDASPSIFQDMLLIVAATQATTAVQNIRLLRSLRQSVAEKEDSQARERRSREDLEALQEFSRTLAGELDLEIVLQRMTDAATRLSGAEFGAFFYNVTDGQGESYLPYTLSGAPRDAFSQFHLPRKTTLFEVTFRGTGVVRLHDVQQDPRYGGNPPHCGLPKGHLPVRSYLAAPVRSRSGDVLGGLFLGHPEAGVFTERAERLVLGMTAQAAVAIDNARLYGQAQTEIAARRRHEAHQEMLLDELNHRVKNTLATVQSIAVQTLKGGATLAEEKEAFQARLAALSKVHDLLTEDNWKGANLRDVVLGPLAPHGVGAGGRFIVDGPHVRLTPRAALALGMAFHELATNAAKYGALSKRTGRVRVAWQVEPAAGAALLRLRWVESGGPPVETPRRRGFGSLMIHRGLSHDLDGEVQLAYEPGGVVCSMAIPLPGGWGDTKH